MLSFNNWLMKYHPLPQGDWYSVEELTEKIPLYEEYMKKENSMFAKFVEFVKINKNIIVKTGVVLLLGAAGAVLLGQLASDEDEPETDEADAAVDDLHSGTEQN